MTGIVATKDAGEVPPESKKYFLTKVGLGMTAFPVVGLFILAGFGKVTADVLTAVTSIMPAYFLAVGALVTGYNASNAYATGKAADAGVLEPQR